MTRELPSVITPITYQGVINALLLAWEVTGTEPTRAAVRLATCQIAIESGLASCRSYNVSGIKAYPTGKYDYQFFATTEYYTDAQLADAKRRGPVEVLGQQTDGRTKVLLRPKHPYCCFRAYETLDSAMRDHLLTLQKTFPHGWTGLLTGDAAKFAAGLRKDCYYTAPQKDYEQGLKWRWSQEIRVVSDNNLVWGDVACQ